MNTGLDSREGVHGEGEVVLLGGGFMVEGGKVGVEFGLGEDLVEVFVDVVLDLPGGEVGGGDGVEVGVQGVEEEGGEEDGFGFLEEGGEEFAGVTGWGEGELSGSEFVDFAQVLSVRKSHSYGY